VYQLIGVIRAAVGTQGWLGDATTLDLHRACATAHVTLEERLPHFRDYPGRTDHHPADGYQLVNILRIQVSHAGHLFHAKWSDLHTKQNLKCME